MALSSSRRRDAQPISHITAMNAIPSPSMITIMSYCSSARVRRRRLSLSAWRFIIGQRHAHHADRAMPVNRPACVASEFERRVCRASIFPLGSSHRNELARHASPKR